MLTIVKKLNRYFQKLSKQELARLRNTGLLRTMVASGILNHEVMYSEIQKVMWKM